VAPKKIPSSTFQFGALAFQSTWVICGQKERFLASPVILVSRRIIELNSIPLRRGTLKLSAGGIVMQ
jgi:hypothetical protein